MADDLVFKSKMLYASESQAKALMRIAEALEEIASQLSRANEREARKG